MSEYDDYVSGKVDRDYERYLVQKRKSETRAARIRDLIKKVADELPDEALDIIEAVAAGRYAKLRSDSPDSEYWQVEVKKSKPCPDCGGSREVPTLVQGDIPWTRACDTCDGTGVAND